MIMVDCQRTDGRSPCGLDGLFVVAVVLVGGLVLIPSIAQNHEVKLISAWAAAILFAPLIGTIYGLN